jgi:hypothetical protein
MRCCASATNDPRPRPRTFAVTTTRRFPFSRTDLIRSGRDVEIGHRAQRDKIGNRWLLHFDETWRSRVRCGFGNLDRNAFERVQIGAEIFGQADEKRMAPVALEDFAGLLSADGDLDSLPRVFTRLFRTLW